jgi:hypothetical protein
MEGNQQGWLLLVVTDVVTSGPRGGGRNRRFGLSETISSVSTSQLNGTWAYVRSILSTRNPEFLGFS